MMATSYRSVAEWHRAAPARMAEFAAPNVRPLLLAAAGATALLLLAPHLSPSTILHDAGLTQLAQAQFYRVLDRVASVVGGNAVVPALALASKAIAALACCFALLRIAATLAAAEGFGFAAGGALIGLGCLTAGAGFITGGGIAIGEMTAAQFGLAFALLSLALAFESRLISAIALLGVVYDAAPSVALWGSFAVAGAVAGLLWDGRRIGGACALGLLGAVLLGTPRWLMGAWLDTTGALAASHAAATAVLQTHRWALWLVPLPNWLLFSCAVVLGLGACGALGPDARAARGALLGIIAVFLFGCVLPFITADPAWLALRPMTSDEPVQLLSAALATAVVMRDLRTRNGLLRMTLSVAVAACLLLHPYLLPFASLAMLARAAAAQGELLGIERRMHEWSGTKLHHAAITALLLAAVGGVILQSGHFLP